MVVGSNRTFLVPSLSSKARKTSSGDLVIWDSYLFRERLVTFEDRLREERDLDVSLGELARSSSGTVQHEKGSL